MKVWNDVTEGSVIYFADEFAELDEVVVSKVEQCENPRYRIITIPGFGEGEIPFQVIGKSHSPSFTVGQRSKDNILVGRIYVSVEAYKEHWTHELGERISELQEHRKIVDENIQRLQGDIDKVNAIPQKD